MNINIFLERLKSGYVSEAENNHITDLEDRLNTLASVSGLDNISVNDSLIQYWHETDSVETKSFLISALNLTDDEQFPEVKSHRTNLIEHMRNHNKFDDDQKAGMELALNKIESYKGSQFRLYIPIINSQLPEGSAHLQKAYTDTLSFFSDNSKNIKVEQGLATKESKPKDPISLFLEKLREQSVPNDSSHIDAIERRLLKLHEISNMEDISINDSLVQYWHQTKDVSRKSFLEMALTLTEQEQFPEVQQHKMKVISHMRNHNDFDTEGLNGMNTALEKIDQYKGSQLRLLMPMLKEKIPNGSESFRKAYNETLDFFGQQSKNIKINQGLATKKRKEQNELTR